MGQLPEQFEQRMKKLLGDEYEAFAASYDKERVQGLRFNSLKSKDGKRENWEKAQTAALAEKTEKCLDTTLKKIPWVKEGYYYEAGARPGKHPLHEAGVYYIQEPSAMAVVELLDPNPGDKVLDLCAAPGGKSSHIASRLKGEGFLLSNEIHPARAKILSQNMERMGVRNSVVTNETPDKLTRYFPRFFDKIVVDAPCSGEGMFRKDEEARNQWSEAHVKMCAGRQAEILDCAAQMLKPGGRMVYSTCTFAPEENEGSIYQFLMRHEDFSLEEPAGFSGFSKGRPDWYAGEKEVHLERCLRIMPHKLEGEGHFMAVLKKNGIPAGDFQGKAPDYLNKNKEKQTWKAAEECLREILREPDGFLKREEYILFGEQLYLLPPQMPAISGLKILRPGLHVGTIKKNRMEPAHALALALGKDAVKGFVELPSDSVEVIRYLKGETISIEPEQVTGKEKGWFLVCTDGFSLGWGKLAGGVLKNHYPKGLRWM